jgi:putative spermidine/putrescine transport system permease protein
MGRQRVSALLLLAPTLALAIYTLVLPMLTFLQFSFYRLQNGQLQPAWSLDAYRSFLTDDYEHAVVLNSLMLASVVTVFSLAIGYPLAYALWRTRRPALQRWLALLIFSPILVSVVVRSYGWEVLLAERGPVNWLIVTGGLAKAPLRLVFNMTGVLISLTHVFLPFVVFPIFAALVGSIRCCARRRAIWALAGGRCSGASRFR